MRWNITSQKTLLSTHPFQVEELHLSENNLPLKHPYHRLQAPDWVNILPLTPQGTAILIRQDRAGSFSTIIETPGGTVDAEDRSPAETAARELEEETGYTSSRLIPLGSLNPNPAIMANRIHYFLATDCVLKPRRERFPDDSERIELFEVPVADLERLVLEGRMDHCLAAYCVLLALRRYPTLKP
jgi:8-oxo-dGTP pyrophosphatase MutT (NUDIX family)